MSDTNVRTFSLLPKRLGAKTLGECIEPLTRPLFKEQGLAGSRIITDWESIVGPTLASHTFPERMSFPKGKKTDGMLVISVENGFATELQHLQPQILERLAGYFGYKAITRLTISHSWVEKPDDRPLPPKPTLAKDAGQLANDVADDELKEALQSLARTMSSL